MLSCCVRCMTPLKHMALSMMHVCLLRSLMVAFFFVKLLLGKFVFLWQVCNTVEAHDPLVDARTVVANDTHSNVEVVTSARQERMRLLGLMRARMHRDKKHLMKAFARPLVLKAFDACKIVRPVIYDLCMCICICSKLAYLKTSKFSVHD